MHTILVRANHDVPVLCRHADPRKDAWEAFYHLFHVKLAFSRLPAVASSPSVVECRGVNASSAHPRCPCTRPLYIVQFRSPSQPPITQSPFYVISISSSPSPSRLLSNSHSLTITQPSVYRISISVSPSIDIFSILISQTPFPSSRDINPSRHFQVLPLTTHTGAIYSGP